MGAHTIVGQLRKSILAKEFSMASVHVVLFGFGKYNIGLDTQMPLDCMSTSLCPLQEPIDFLSLSDQKPLPLGRASAGAVRSMDLDKESLPKTENRRLFSRKLKKTVSCPPLREMPLRETYSVGSVALGDSRPAEGAAALDSPGHSPPTVGTVLHQELVTPFPERKAPLSPFDPQTEGKLAQPSPHHSAKGLQQDGINQTATLTNGTL